MQCVARRIGIGADQQPHLVSEREPDPAVSAADGTRTDPHHFARRTQRVEVGLAVLGHPGRQNRLLQHRGWQRGTLQDPDHISKTVGAAAWNSHPLPGGEKAGQSRLLNRCNLGSKRRQGSSTELPEDTFIDPLA